MSSCSTQIKSKDTARVVIIGAGAAGIAAATRLLLQGFKHVDLLEAEARIGGRVHSIPLADTVVELGAEWCHGQIGNVVYEKVKDLNLLEGAGDIYDKVQTLRSNKQEIPEETVNILRTIAEESLPGKEVTFEGSLGEYLTQTYWREINKLSNVDRTLASEYFENFKREECSYNGCDNVFELSGRDHLEYEECEGEPVLHWRNKGYKTFLRLLMNAQQDQPEDLGVLNGRVQCNKRIVEINWEGTEELTLRLRNGEVITADHVICTVSLGVLKEQYASMFVPALPEAKLRAIKCLKLGTVNKLILEYNVQPLPTHSTGFRFLWRAEDLRELRGSKRFWLEGISGFDIVISQPRVLEGWIVGEHARHMETLTEAEVLEDLQWLFRKFVPFNMPQPEKFLRSQWHSNPNFRGSFSFRTTCADELRTGPADLEAPLLNACGKPRLLFAGEATSKTHYSSVHGATETGWREANRLNDFYNRSTWQL